MHKCSLKSDMPAYGYESPIRGIGDHGRSTPSTGSRSQMVGFLTVFIGSTFSTGRGLDTVLTGQDDPFRKSSGRELDHQEDPRSRP